MTEKYKIIRIAMLEQGYNFRTLADKMGISLFNLYNKVQKIKHGKYISEQSMFDICKALDLEYEICEQ